MTASKQTEKLVNDVKTVVRDAEDLIKATGTDLSERTREARDRLKVGLDSARETARKAESKLRDGVRETDVLIREYPYQSIGIAAAVGLLLGVLLGRR
jgi:ElaB/YqjD/DUF883 family membrane-anchored ribosome-binding protein